ncbi:MAG: hypothetical protein KJ804_18765 [Proteobacteria bacterium]|nr:hypothetical protein [Pseudomonadota bacterium]MBU1060351.1 hypothetical protein [Pseudomonadota bacterium]
MYYLSSLFLWMCLWGGICSAILLPVSAGAGESESPSPWSLYISAVQAAATTGRVNSCINTSKELCESERDYCLMSVQEKISEQLQICYEEKLACGDSCSADFDDCVEIGTPQSECHTQWEICDAACANAGVLCQVNAINGTYEQLPAEVCDSEYVSCIDRWYAYCVVEY